jgi:hypothetical protein
MHDGCAREMGARNERKNLKCHLHVIFFLSLYRAIWTMNISDGPCLDIVGE